MRRRTKRTRREGEGGRKKPKEAGGSRG